MDNHAYIGRQPILDGHNNIFGYELLYRHTAKATKAVILNEFEACASIVSSTLTDMGAEWLLGDNLAFINITPELLDSDLLNLLPSDRVVLELGAKGHEIAELPCQLRQVRSKGFRVALEDLLPSRHNLPLLEVADFIKLDVQQFDAKTLTKAISHYRHHPLKLVAKKVETMKEYLACVELGFDYFQGFHFAHPETLSVKVINPASLTVLELLNKVRANADVSEIETTFKRNMALSYKLLRYINSTSFGLRIQIQSIHHALTILGYRQLYRWLTLLLITPHNGSPSPALIQTAITRGKFTELLGQEHLQGHERDNLFIVGIFSLLDAILEMPMDTILETLNLPENIADALLQREGIYAPYLKLAEACEQMDFQAIEDIAASLMLSPDKVNRTQFEALTWTENLTQQSAATSQ